MTCLGSPGLEKFPLVFAAILFIALCLSAANIALLTSNFKKTFFLVSYSLLKSMTDIVNCICCIGLNQLWLLYSLLQIPVSFVAAVSQTGTPASTSVPVPVPSKDHILAVLESQQLLENLQHSAVFG